MKKINISNTITYSIAMGIWLWILYGVQIGFKTILDEGYFVLGLNPHQELRIQHTQFFEIARFIFDSLSINVNIFYSRIVCYVLICLALLIFSVSSYRWLKIKENVKGYFFFYLSLIFTWGSVIFLDRYEISFTFNHLQVFLTATLLSFYLLFDCSSRAISNLVLSFFIGFTAFIAILNYLPSSLLLLLVIVFLMILKQQKSMQRIVALGALLAGILISALLYNSFVFPVLTVFSDLMYNVKHPSFGTGGYGIHFYILSLYSYLKNFYLVFLSGIGLFAVFHIFKKWNNVFAYSCLIAVTMMFIVLEKRYIGLNLLIIPMVSAIFSYIVETPISFPVKHTKLDWVNVLQKIIFFFFPVIALQGTNVPIHEKLCFTAYLWGFFLAIYLFKIQSKKVFRYILFLSLFLAVYLGLYLQFYHFGQFKGLIFDSKYTVENTQYNHIRLKKSQINYFERVKKVMESTDYDSDTDKILTLDFDYGTLLYLNTTNYGGLMHHIPNMYAYGPVFQSKENEPDYIILPESSISGFQELAKHFDWDFPESYTRYDVGNPESEDFSATRCVFVKINDNRIKNNEP